VVSAIGARPPAEWHETHRAWTIGAISRSQVTFVVIRSWAASEQEIRRKTKQEARRTGELFICFLISCLPFSYSPELL